MDLPAGWSDHGLNPIDDGPVWVAASPTGRVRALLSWDLCWELRIVVGDRVEVLRTMRLTRVREWLRRMSLQG